MCRCKTWATAKVVTAEMVTRTARRNCTRRSASHVRSHFPAVAIRVMPSPECNRECNRDEGVYTRPDPQNNKAACNWSGSGSQGDRMKPATAPSALKVQAVLGPALQVLEFEASTRTSEDAAAAVGCTVAEIAKSLIFKAADGRP